VLEDELCHPIAPGGSEGVARGALGVGGGAPPAVEQFARLHAHGYRQLAAPQIGPRLPHCLRQPLNGGILALKGLAPDGGGGAFHGIARADGDQAAPWAFPSAADSTMSAVASSPVRAAVRATAISLAYHR
jgi:hypothetical protein